MKLQLLTPYFRIKTYNPLSFFIKWWYCTNGKGSYWLEVHGKVQQFIAKKIYKTIKFPCSQMDKTGVTLIKLKNMKQEKYTSKNEFYKALYEAIGGVFNRFGIVKEEYWAENLENFITDFKEKQNK